MQHRSVACGKLSHSDQFSSVAQDNILSPTHDTHISLKTPTPTPFHLAWPSWVRQQVTHINLILQPPEKQAPTKSCPPRTYPVLGLATLLQGLRTVSVDHCHTSYSDHDPENASAALGCQSKQAVFSWVKRGLGLPMVLMLQWKGCQEQGTPRVLSLLTHTTACLVGIQNFYRYIPCSWITLLKLLFTTAFKCQ